MLRAFLRGGPAAGRVRGAGADDDVFLDAPDDRLGPALVAAARGAYGPAAELLAATRAHAEWEHRDRYAGRLAAFARSRAEWLREWRAAAPDDPDALLVEARLTVDRCWDSPARAELLRQAGPAVAAVAEAGGRDPVPWRIVLDTARGAHAGHTEFARLWAQAVRRSPHHYGCHVAALEYLAAASPGAHRECLDFAETAAQDAPEDALVRTLPVRAALGCLTDRGGPGVERTRLDAAADRAIALSAAYPAADPWPAELRNALAYVLVRLGRRREAAEQLRLTGPYATSFPWDRETDDPLGRFLQVRANLQATAPGRRVTAGSGHPRRGRGSRRGPGEH
ncbi:hypothetical protein [Streptomyces tagetis]|uniref:DUF4034 domain-containing protein n=1 Tax=Streptomyces tagetis TaxID=2820809 RepID=A0A941B3K3_9ACTN|nr:hypothetical protein [Streptomyces sp. RG38]MBQ0830470.1 hypothetical protein [Streptomyces sp. RG38]